MSQNASSAPQGNSQPPVRDEIISYQKLRAFIGITGILLPVAVVIGCFSLGTGEFFWQISISHYYYSVMHVIFVCILCVLGGFLFTYRGKYKSESRLANIAGCCAFGIAAFPTSVDGFQPVITPAANQYLQLTSKVSGFWSNMHFVFAAGLFLCFIIFCLYFFQKPDGEYTGHELVKFKRRKVIYKICGWAIVISLVMIALFSLHALPARGIFIYNTFIFETTALWAFGTAWLIKGSSALKGMPVVKQLIQPLR
jgi:hypothetical protein